MNGRVLLVDDEQQLLDGLRRTLRGRYDVSTANSGAEGLALLAESVAAGDPFAVIVSDMRMPLMDGAEFLGRAKGIAPDAIAMILSGQADLTSTIAAVNNADLFRFLNKPCSADDLGHALDAALRQHQLVAGEKELLERTLGGAVEVLTQVLSMASPQASRRTARMRAVVGSVAEQLGLTSDWRLPMAAMLSQIGCIAVPGPVLEKLDAGELLTLVEMQMVLESPATARRLLERIPRLEDVAAWVGDQAVDPDEVLAGTAPIGTSGDPAAAILPAVSAYLALFDVGAKTRDIASKMAKTERYDLDLIEAIRQAVEQLSPRGVPRQIMANSLRPDMVLTADVLTTSGLILVRAGERVTEVLAQRVNNFAHSVGVVEPIEVVEPSHFAPAFDDAVSHWHAGSAAVGTTV
jgi:CheY-like chemotaxis protein